METETSPSPKALTPRQRQIVEGIKRHLTRDEIAAELGINSRVVKDHVQALCERYDCPARELPDKIGL